jgi:hypothetical protein
MRDIKEAKEVAIFAVKLVYSGKKALENGKIGFEDLPVVISLLPYLNNAIKGVDQVLPEIQDLDGSEWDEIAAEIVPVVGDVAGEQIKAIVESSLNILKQALEAFGLLKKSFDAFKLV